MSKLYLSKELDSQNQLVFEALINCSFQYLVLLNRLYNNVNIFTVAQNPILAAVNLMLLVKALLIFQCPFFLWVGGGGCLWVRFKLGTSKIYSFFSLTNFLFIIEMLTFFCVWDIWNYTHIITFASKILKRSNFAL